VLLRTGWLAGFLAIAAEERPSDAPSTGLAQGPTTVAWLRERRLTAIAADNPGLEVHPAADGPLLHEAMLGELGLAVGELWWLEDLAADCAATGIWDGLLVSVPLNLPGGCGSPANAIVLR
jgi:kynurenine formamidase